MSRLRLWRPRAIAGSAAAALALLLAACGEGLRTGANLCAIVPDDEAAAALGVAVEEARAVSGDRPQCAWKGAAAEDGLPRAMSAAVWRESAVRRAGKATSGALHFEEELKALERDFPRTRVVGDAGQVAVMGFGAVGDERFVGGFVARKGADVLVMRIEGADPAAFEAAARRIVERM